MKKVDFNKDFTKQCLIFCEAIKTYLKHASPVQKHKTIDFHSTPNKSSIPSLNINRLPHLRALLCQLNQPNHLSSFNTASRKIALSCKSPSELAVVLCPGGGFDGGDDILDRGAVLDGCQGA